jgi:hypothetical protein
MNTLPSGVAETRVARLESISEVIQGDRSIVIARLSDGSTLRVHMATIEQVRKTIGLHNVGHVMAYDIDHAGNRFNPRAADAEQVARFRQRHDARAANG